MGTDNEAVPPPLVVSYTWQQSLRSPVKLIHLWHLSAKIFYKLRTNHNTVLGKK